MPEDFCVLFRRRASVFPALTMPGTLQRHHHRGARRRTAERGVRRGCGRALEWSPPRTSAPYWTAQGKSRAASASAKVAGSGSTGRTQSTHGTPARAFMTESRQEADRARKGVLARSKCSFRESHTSEQSSLSVSSETSTITRRPSRRRRRQPPASNSLTAPPVHGEWVIDQYPDVYEGVQLWKGGSL